MTTLAHSFRYFVLMLALQLSGHACDAADVCACSPTSYIFEYLGVLATCPTSMNPPSGSGIANVTCVGNRDTFLGITLFPASVTVTEVSTQGSSMTQQFSADLSLFAFNSAVNASFIPQRLELRTQTTPIESTITISYTNACTGMPALQNGQEIGFYELVRNSLLFSLFSCVILLSLVTDH
jgi:hypothetical protein